MTKKSKNEKAIVLISGGMDSLVTTALAKEDNEELYAIHLNYGQRTQDKELSAFNKICSHYGIHSNQRKIIDLSFLEQIKGSSLTDQNIPLEKNSDPAAKDHVPSSYVPFRNSIILALAVALAEVEGAKKIYIGAVYEDASGYPDCTPSYYEAYNKLIREGSAAKDITIETPIIHLLKKDIVAKGVELKAPLELSWSCYGNEDAACGECDSCQLRLKGFKDFGMEDPIPYKKVMR